MSEEVGVGQTAFGQFWCFDSLAKFSVVVVVIVLFVVCSWLLLLVVGLLFFLVVIVVVVVCCCLLLPVLAWPVVACCLCVCGDGIATTISGDCYQQHFPPSPSSQKSVFWVETDLAIPTLAILIFRLWPNPTLAKPTFWPI